MGQGQQGLFGQLQSETELLAEQLEATNLIMVNQLNLTNVDQVQRYLFGLIMEQW
jgi:hypothetical protein